jgi:hypothetical protein
MKVLLYALLCIVPKCKSARDRLIPDGSSVNRKRALSSALFMRVEVPLALKIWPSF